VDEECFVQSERGQEKFAARLIPLVVAPRRPKLACPAVIEPRAVWQQGTRLVAVALDCLLALIAFALYSDNRGFGVGEDSHLILERPQLLAALAQPRVELRDLDGKLSRSPRTRHLRVSQWRAPFSPLSFRHSPSRSA
jgi:hypothetical protein